PAFARCAARICRASLQAKHFAFTRPVAAVTETRDFVNRRRFKRMSQTAKSARPAHGRRMGGTASSQRRMTDARGVLDYKACTLVHTRRLRTHACPAQICDVRIS